MSGTKIKARIIIKVTVEYDITPEYYDESIRNDPQAMLAVDIQGANEDPFLMMDRDGAKWEITGETEVKP